MVNPYQNLDAPVLNDAGLNCQAVFDIDALPTEAKDILLQRCPSASGYRQLILIGHGGRQFWEALREQVPDKLAPYLNDVNAKSDIDPQSSQAHPIDDFTVSKVREFMQKTCADSDYEIVYPGAQYLLSLQELGRLAGWHHESPFMVGINASFGSWFAYRAVILANTNLPASEMIKTEAPCSTCSERVCISSCPANALDNGEFHLLKCVSYRQQDNSRCQITCLARWSCPVGSEHRYTEEQMAYHYGRSLRIIQQFKAKT